VLTDEAGRVISSEGRGDVDADPTGEQFPWEQQAFSPIHRAGDRPNMVLLLAGAMSNSEASMALVKRVADDVCAERKDLGFHYVLDPEHCKTIRSRLQVEEEDVALVALPSKSVLKEADITEEAVRKLL
jgi:hypothetical protein